MDYGKSDLTLAPLESPNRFLDAGLRCFLSGFFALALWSLVLLTELGSCTFVTFAFAGTFLTNLALRGTRKWELPAVLLFGTIYGIAYLNHGGPLSTIPGSTLGIIGAFLGIGSLAVKSIRGIWETDPQAVKSNRENVLELGSIPLLCILSGIGVSLAARSLVMTYDPLLYGFDATLGYPPGFAMGQFFRAHVSIAYASALAYNYLPIGLVALRALQLREGGTQLDLRLIYAALGTAGFCLYAICPGIGPINRFPGFPYDLPSTAGLLPLPAGPLLPRNAMPSLHVGWALLVFVNSWSRSRTRWVALGAAVFLVLTAIATLGSGEHFLVDLIVVLPLTLAIQAAFKASGRLRISSVLLGSALTLTWLVALRTGVLLSAPKVLSVGSVWLTAAISFTLHAKIARASWVR